MPHEEGSFKKYHWWMMSNATWKEKESNMGTKLRAMVKSSMEKSHKSLLKQSQVWKDSKRGGKQCRQQWGDSRKTWGRISTAATWGNEIQKIFQFSTQKTWLHMMAESNLIEGNEIATFPSSSYIMIIVSILWRSPKILSQELMQLEIKQLLEPKSKYSEPLTTVNFNYTLK